MAEFELHCSPRDAKGEEIAGRFSIFANFRSWSDAFLRAESELSQRPGRWLVVAIRTTRARKQMRQRIVKITKAR